MTAIRSKTIPLALAGLVALPVALSAGDAGADGVRVRVRARASASASVRVGRPSARVYARPRVTVRHRPRVRTRPRARLVVGGYYGFYYSSPPPAYTYYDDCYYPVYAYRPAPAPAPVVARTVAPQPALPRLGIGISASGVATSDDVEGDDVSVFGRLRVFDPLEIEIEAAKTELDDGLRVDRRLGAALYFDFAPRSTWGLYVVGGTGAIETDVNGGAFEQERVYAEGGAGLRWTLSRNFSLTGDVRWGGTAAVEDDDDEILPAAAILPGVPDEEDYMRVRLAGILHF